MLGTVSVAIVTSPVPLSQWQQGQAEVGGPLQAGVGLFLILIQFTSPSLLLPLPPKLSSISHSLCLNHFKEEKCNKINRDCFL